MATGYIDTNGVYRYGEDDEIPTLSTFLDLGQAAQSAQFSGVKARLAAVEALTQVPVLTGRYSSTLTVPNGAVTATTTWANTAGFTSTGASTLWTPITSGLRFNKRGLYALSMMVGCSNQFGGRNFVDCTVTGYGSKRLSWFLQNEDNVPLSVNITVPTDNVAVTFGAYQASGASKPFTFLLDVARLGNFS
jgi:hypothetical protein